MQVNARVMATQHRLLQAVGLSSAGVIAGRTPGLETLHLAIPTTAAMFRKFQPVTPFAQHLGVAASKSGSSANC